MKHGHNTVRHGRSPTYISWQRMRHRCNDPLNEDYGMQGITYDPRWDDFRVFLDDMGERPDGTTLDRIDFTGNYCKENCRWADAETQNNNRSNTRWLEFNGQRKSVSSWSRELGINVHALHKRIHNYGWSVERALTTPKRNYRRAA